MVRSAGFYEFPNRGLTLQVNCASGRSDEAIGCDEDHRPTRSFYAFGYGRPWDSVAFTNHDDLLVLEHLTLPF